MRKLLLGVGCAILTISANASNTQLIIKYKESDIKKTGISSTKLQPLSLSNQQKIQQLAGATVNKADELAGGAYVVTFDHELSLADIAALKNSGEFEYVQEDRHVKLWPNPGVTITTPQTSESVTSINLHALDMVLSSGSLTFNPIQYDMFGVVGSHVGNNFESAFANSAFSSMKPGNGIVVAVIDTGYTPHPNFESNLVGYNSAAESPVSGYTFISACAIRGPGSTNGCTSSYPDTGAYVSPSVNGNDSGDWIGTIDGNSAYANWVGTDRCGATDKSSWHSTHVIGTIIGQGYGNNYSGVTIGSGSMLGGAYGAKVLPVRALGHCGGQNSDIVLAISYAIGQSGYTNATPAKVINMSLGGDGACDSATQSVINAANKVGTIVVVAAGNGYVDGSDTNNVLDTSPAGCDGVIRVAATGDSNLAGTNQALASYSYWGATTITASGSDIYSTLSSSLTTLGSASYIYAKDTGTSMATPHVAAAIADLLSIESTLKLADIQQILMNSAIPLNNYTNIGGSVYTGNLDVESAINYLQNIKYMVITDNNNNEYVQAGNSTTVKFVNNSGSTINVVKVVDRDGNDITNKVVLSSNSVVNGGSVTVNMANITYNTSVRLKDADGNVVASVIYIQGSSNKTVTSSSSGGCSMLVGSSDYTLIMILGFASVLWLYRRKTLIK